MKRNILYLTILGLAAFAVTPSFAASALTQQQKKSVDSLVEKLYNKTFLKGSKQYRRSFRSLLENIQTKKTSWFSTRDYDRSKRILIHILDKLKAGKHDDIIAINDYFEQVVGASSRFGYDFSISDYLEDMTLRNALYNFIAEEMPELVGDVQPQQEATTTRRTPPEEARVAGLGTATVLAGGAAAAIRSTRAREQAHRAYLEASRKILNADSEARRRAFEQQAAYESQARALPVSEAPEDLSLEEAGTEDPLEQARLAAARAAEAAKQAEEAATRAQMLQALHKEQAIPYGGAPEEAFGDPGAEESALRIAEERVAEQAARELYERNREAIGGSIESAKEGQVRAMIQRAAYERQAIPSSAPESAFGGDLETEFTEQAAETASTVQNARETLEKVAERIAQQDGITPAAARSVETALNNTSGSLGSLSEKIDDIVSSASNRQEVQAATDLKVAIEKAEASVEQGIDAFNKLKTDVDTGDVSQVQSDAADLQEISQVGSELAATITAAFADFADLFGETQFDYSEIGASLEGIGAGLQPLFEALSAAGQAAAEAAEAAVQ